MAFQPNAFQNDAFQVARYGTAAGELPALAGRARDFEAVPAFQPGAFQYPAFQTQLRASATGLLPALVGLAMGAGEVSGTVVGTLPALTGSALGAVVVSGTFAGMLPGLEGEAEGTSSINVGVLPELTGDGEGTVSGVIIRPPAGLFRPPVDRIRVKGLFRGELPSLIGHAEGLVLTPQLEVAFTPPPKEAIPGTISGAGGGRLGSLKGAGEGRVPNVIRLEAYMPSPTGDAEATTFPFGDDELIDIALLLEAA